jgi:hypothetical protein
LICLELNFLGGFDVQMDGQAVTGFESDKPVCYWLTWRSSRTAPTGGKAWQACYGPKARNHVNSARMNPIVSNTIANNSQKILKKRGIL